MEIAKVIAPYAATSKEQLTLAQVCTLYTVHRTPYIRQGTGTPYTACAIKF